MKPTTTPLTRTRRFTRLGMHLLTIFCAFLTSLPAWGQALEWKSGFNVRGSTNEFGEYGEIASLEDGVGAIAVSATAVFYAGGFDTFGGIQANRIVRVDKTTGAVTALGSGVNGYVRALAVIGSDLYAGGDFSTAGGVATVGIAKWNGTAWSALGSGVNGTVTALAVIGSDLYVGGGFPTAGGVTANGLAKWNGTAWSAVGGGVTGYVNALTVSGSDLYVGGPFTAAGAVPAVNIAKWNGTVWSALGAGMPDRVVSSIAVIGTTVFAGLSEGDMPNQFLYRWDGTAWFSLSGYVDTYNGAVSTLMVHGGNLYVGGNFDGTLFRVVFDGVEDWYRDDDFGSDSDRKVGFAQGVNTADVIALAQDGAAIYAGGRFTQVWTEDQSASAQGYTSAVNAAKIVPDSNQSDGWGRSAVVAGNGLAHSGMDSFSAKAILDEGAVVWVAGQFAFAGGKINSTPEYQAGIARWTKATRTWTAANDGELTADTVITSLARANGKLYAGGENGNLFRLNDTDPNYLTWEYVGTANNSIDSLAALGTDLIVAGSFTSVEGTPAASIAKWNGTAWSALGSGITGGGLNRGVYALKAVGSDLYAGGNFATAGGVAAVGIAKWNGTAWSAVGSAFTTNDYIYSLATLGSDLVAGGLFTGNIQKWNGTAWSVLGSGLNGGVYGLNTNGSNLYAAGEFILGAGRGAAVWNGSTWSALGTGVYSSLNGDIGGRAIAADGTSVFVGGTFTKAGGIPSHGFAEYGPAPVPPLVTLIDDKFDNGVIATNTLGVGNGFVSYSQSVLPTESGGFLNLDIDDGAATRTFVSNPADALNPFGSVLTTQTTTFGTITRGTGNQRFWIGYRVAGSTTHFFPTMGVQGLFLSVITQNQDGFTSHGNLVAVSNTGVVTTLASWTWANPNALSGLVATLKTTATTYEVSFSGAAGGTPTFVTGAASGALTGMGTLGGNFVTGLYNQYWSGSFGGAKVDRVLVQRGAAVNTAPTITLPASLLIAEATSASGAVVNFSITGTDAESGALVGSGVPASGSTFALGDTTVTATVTDGALTDTGTFIVRVRDTTAPSVTAPANVNVVATSSAGAVVTYSAASATDAVTASPSISYSIASGSLFPVGATTVTVSATDAATNVGTATFTVNVADFPGTLAFANATPSANPVNGSGLLNTVPVLITRSGGTGGAITVEVAASQPATVPTGFVKYVYGTDYQFASGSTVSFAAGQASATVDIQLKTPVLTKKGQLKLTLTSTTGGAVIGSPAAATLTINARDTAAPTIVLATPVAGATFDITGTVKDAGVLASLTVKVNGATLPLTVDPVTGYVANAIAPYSVLGAIAENGPNVILVTAKDLSGNTATATKTVTYLNNRPALTGTYTALIKPTGTPDGDTTGFLTATLTVAGKITGKVTLSGVTVSFTGLLNNAGVATFSNISDTALDLIDSTEFDAYLGALAFSVSTPGGLVGTLNTSASGGTLLATCAGTKTPYSSTNLVPAGLLTAATKGVYTVAFPSKAQSPVLTASAYPQGDGYATLTLTNAGAITVLGKFADGTALSSSGNLRADGTLPFFASLYKKLGLVAGDLTFTNLADSDISGSDLIWIRPAQRTARYYRYGWETGIRIDALGAKYTSPAALNFGQGAVDTVNGNAALVFTDGQLASTITHNVNVNPTTGAVTTVPVAGAPYKLTLTASTGVFTGTFTHGTDTDTYRGVLINKGANKGGFGYFLSTVPLIYGASGESGGVSLQP